MLESSDSYDRQVDHMRDKDDLFSDLTVLNLADLPDLRFPLYPIGKTNAH